jgi:hypothetical protein
MRPEENSMLDSSYVYQVEDIIAEINGRTGMRIELHPSWHYPIWTKSGSELSFKLRDTNGDRQFLFDLHLSRKEFVSRSGKKRLTDLAAARITHEIEEFFSSAAGEKEVRGSAAAGHGAD